MGEGVFHTLSNELRLGEGRALLSRNLDAFRVLEKHAMATADPEPFAGRAVWAYAAGAARHPGALVSADLERRLLEIGRGHVPSPAVGHRPAARPERVLHVLTEAYDSGGHTRVAERWIAADSDCVANVVITGRDQPQPIPASLIAAVSQSGGQVMLLPDGPHLQRAAALRRVATEHDLVVLHIHQFDVTAVLALAEAQGRPPTILFNHSSHHLWVGVGVADVIANLQEVDVVNSAVRRGAPRESQFLLPIPALTRDVPTRSEARSALGLASSELQLVLVVGTEFKIQTPLSPSFAELIAEVCARNPAAVVMLVGPSKELPIWADLQSRYPGRVQPMGPLPVQVVHMLMSAADLLLDTWPLSGGTTLVDAGYSRLPVVSLSDGGEGTAIVRPPATALGGSVTLAQTVDDLALEVAELLQDDARRSDLGRIARAFVDEHHVTGWSGHLARVVSVAKERRGQAAAPGQPAPEQTDWEAVLALTYELAGIAPSAIELLCGKHLLDLAPAERPRSVEDALARMSQIAESAG